MVPPILGIWQSKEVIFIWRKTWQTNQKKGIVMKFKSGTRRRAIEYEKALVDYWKENKTFEKSVEQRPADNSYVFYDGPPFITGVPHHGTLLSSIIKDAVPRYWTMKGKRVERVWGWDSHGLPAENFVEKQLGITDRRDIGTKISLEEYITKARESMVANSATWEDVIDRVGRWVDFNGAYKTMDKDFMESVWWAFKTLYEKGKIYEGEKVLMYDTKFATPVSKAEVTMDNDAYQTVTDPSVYVKFKLVDDDYSVLAWTTTPWTLPGNTAVAVNKDLDYVRVTTAAGNKLILAHDLVEKISNLGQADQRDEIVEVGPVFKGSELIGREYEPLFENQGENAHRIWQADYVSADDGTGIVHIAPAYGEVDFDLAKAQNIPIRHVIDDNGYYFDDAAKRLYGYMPWRNADEQLEVWSSNKDIAKGLEKAGIVWKIDYIQHEYPFNPRSKQRIMYRAIPSWFFDITDSKQLMLEKNENINWFPPHLKHGRFAKNIEQAPDWNLSRDRFWATAMPVWKGTDTDGNERVKVIGSYAELRELSGVELEDYHRPWVDDIEFDLDGVHYKRVDKVLDGWFESGSMPFAQFHYPFENKEKFEANFPGDFIVEYIAQVRAWFYYVHVLNTSLFGSEAFRNVITTGTLAGNDGRKMSKSLGNFTDPNELMDKFSADSLRFLFLSSPLLSGEDFSLQDKDVGDVARKLSMVWNMYDFFTLYAEADGWEFDPEKPSSLTPEDLTNPLDKWVVSRLHELNEHITKHMDEYNIPVAMSDVLPFIDDASNWFVRRSRRRFWKSEDDGDKADAYRTLHYVLMKLSLILAPFTPFLAEELYQKIGGSSESVHLLDWPTDYSKDELVLEEMATVRDYVNQALSLRASEKIKIRQPLASITVPSLGKFVNFEDILSEELNVKKVIQGSELTLDFTITPELKREGLMREIIRHVQAARKNAGLNVDDRIELNLVSDASDLNTAIEEHQNTIAEETLAQSFGDAEGGYETTVSIDDMELRICLKKV
jgi:isoleucyl-tRNA synthetase